MNGIDSAISIVLSALQSQPRLYVDDIFTRQLGVNHVGTLLFNVTIDLPYYEIDTGILRTIHSTKSPQFIPIDMFPLGKDITEFDKWCQDAHKEFYINLDGYYKAEFHAYCVQISMYGCPKLNFDEYCNEFYQHITLRKLGRNL